MTMRTNDTITHVISKSGKNRQGAKYTREGKILDKDAGPFKQVVEITPFGKTVKGKTKYVSQTRHVRS